MAGSFDELEGKNTSGPSPVFKTGKITPTQYEQCFGPKDVPGGSVAWILVDLQGKVDTRSDLFRIWVSGLKKIGEEGTPDPDTFGVIRH